MVLATAVLAASQTTEYKPKFTGDPARSEAEPSALGYMRTVVTAQKLYKKKHGKYASALASLVGSGSFTKRMTNTNRGDYQVGFRGKPEGYNLALTPRQFDGAHRAFFVDESGAIRGEDDKPASAKSPPLK